MSGNTVAGVAGSAVEQKADCGSDGATDCAATATYAAALTTGLAAKVITTNTVAGVAGSATEEARANCSSDGETACIATATYTAGLVTGLGPKVVSGNTVAGVAGSAVEQKADCGSDGATDCAATATYAAALTTGLAAKVITTNTVAGVAGSATEEARANCSSDGATACIATATYTAALTTGLGPKVVTGNTVAGVAGSAVELHADCNAAGQDDCTTTSTYRYMDLSAKDAGGAIDITNALFSARIKSSFTFEFWDETGTRYTVTGDADIIEANIVDSTVVFGVTGTLGAALDCASIGVGGTWILVPGDSDYGTNDFCVMKYEAKDSSGSPVSEAAGTPWVSITQTDARTECASLGKGYRLISNDEYMTIGANLANVASNWSNGTVGDAELARGHSDDNPSNMCAADASDANAYVETTCTGSSSGTFNQRRTHTLSNGEVIWDLAGNAWEWTSYFNDEEKPTPAVASTWYQYTQPVVGTSTMPLSDLIPTNALKSFWDDTWNATESIGKYYPGSDGSGGALTRGNAFDDGDRVGVFTARLSRNITATNADLGFRCTVSVP
ncbi:MAG: hypothetical protein AB8G05_18010 [Oligoflexales bacterium]